MKMVKSLLLGSAAGLVAVAGAQAADLPVKAKPVEYVKVCSAYGAGFYYIPGTDICLRIGGYVWSEFEVNDYGAGPNYATGAIGSDSIRNRGDDWTSFRVRFDMIFDARTNTEYGTLRSYASVGWQWTTNSGGFMQQQLPASTGNYAWYYDRAFIQFAGLTFGYVGSFFDFDPSLIINQQTSKSFKFAPAIAYTAQLGNGISATVSMEDSTTRRLQITTFGTVGGVIFGYNAPSTTLLAGTGTNTDLGPVTPNSGFGTNFYSGQFMPDFIANIRVDQAWGDAQLSGAVHQVKTTLVPAGFSSGAGSPFLTGNPFAKVKYGYAALAGMNFKLPMLGAGDSFQVEGAWSRGAADYTGLSANPYSNASSLGYRKGAFGPVIDLFDSFVDGNGQHLATAWSINAELRHFWTPTIRSSVAYGYNKFKAPAAAQAFTSGGVACAAAVGGAASTKGFGCFPSGTIDQVTANIIWSPVPKLDVGLEGVWFRMKTDCGGLNSATCATDQTRGKSNDTFGGVFRVRRDF